MMGASLCLPQTPSPALPIRGRVREIVPVRRFAALAGEEGRGAFGAGAGARP